MSKIDLNAIKLSIKNSLDAENTTASSVIDLSAGMASRVQQVMQVNLARIPMQPSFFPAVTIYFDNKDINTEDIATTQRIGRRRAEINMKIAGVVFLNAVSDDLLDDADNEVENLMENIEEIVRNDPELSGNVKWTSASRTNYHNVALSEDSMMRIGILDIQAVTFY